MKKLIYILLFITSQSTHFVWGQEDSKWLMFKYDSIEEKQIVPGSRLQKYCSFLNIKQDSSRFVLYEYLMCRTENGKTLYGKFVYNGNYAYTKDSAALELIPGGVTIFSRIGGKETKEEKSFSENFIWNLFLNPYRLILFDRDPESLFNANPFYFSIIVCQMLDNDQFKKYDSAYEKWDHGQWEYPPIDSTLLVDTNKYYWEIPNLESDEVQKVELYFYRQQEKGVDVLRFDYILEPDSLITITSEPRSNHILVHKHYLMLQNEGFEVKFKNE